MRRIKLTLILVFAIIFVIVGISFVLPEVYLSDTYSDVDMDQEWTPVDTNTPAQTVTASPTPTTQKRVVNVDTPMPTKDTNCVFPSEYWREHTELWLDLEVGNATYTKADIYSIFDRSSSQIQQILLKQLYLTNLNVFSGADPFIIQDVLIDAHQWLQENQPDKPLSGEARSVAVQLAQTLAAFNTGVIGSGYCSPYETLTVTPLVVPSLTPTPSPTATATRVIVTLQPSATATRDRDSDNKPKPTNPPPPTRVPDTPVPPPTDPPPPPTDAPPDP